MNLRHLNHILPELSNSPTMPVLFIGHGIPTNALADNEFTRSWREIAKKIPQPKAILCISAHWETNGTYLTAMQYPTTIHDYGFMGRELRAVEYKAPGNPTLAHELQGKIHSSPIQLNQDWGFDHGCWVVMRHLYPQPDIPIIEMSLDRTKDGISHFQLARELHFLRQKGVLIVASGGSVHNMKRALGENQAHDWAVEADRQINSIIANGDGKKLVRYQELSKEINLGIPTPEHYLPLLYALGLQGKNEAVEVFNNKTAYGSFSMTCLKIG